MKSVGNLVRRSVSKLHAYVPGEQPKGVKLIKLNTNENPFPPAPPVLKAVRAAVDGRLRLYPNPAAQPLRERLAAMHGCDVDHVIVGNGSDDLLALATRAFVEPVGAAKRSVLSGGARSRSTIQYFVPSYSLYSVLSDIHDAIRNEVRLNPDFDIPDIAESARARKWDRSAALTFVTTPNAPSGRGYAIGQLRELCRLTRGVVVLDEAYVDFAEENAMALVDEFPNVIVSRTFSKAYSLCFQRIGYFIGNPSLIGALDKVRDSYNVNGLGQVAAVATLDHLEYYRKNFGKIVREREHTARQLTLMGFRVLPSQANFLLAQPPRGRAEDWMKRLRARGILVRWFSAKGIDRFIRVTIGTTSEMKAFRQCVAELLPLDWS